MTDMQNKGEIIIYTSQDGQITIDARLENKTIWLTQKSMAELFDVKVPAINKHLNNIFKDGELEKQATVSKMEIVQNEGGREIKRTTAFYNLDAIISVGYRINSVKATQFRKWATNILHKYLVDGYALNQTKLKQEEDKVKTLQNTIQLLTRSLSYQAQTITEAKDIAKLLDNFANGLDLLDNYDHKQLDTKGKTTRQAVIIEESEFLTVIDKMKSDFASDVFAKPKDESFSSSVKQIYQTFGGVDLYPTLEEKATMLLYLIVKNHSFTDGNKRIGASCFLYFLNKNKMLYKNGTPIIDNSALFALTLLIATSKKEEMELVKQIILSILNRGLI